MSNGGVPTSNIACHAGYHSLIQFETFETNKFYSWKKINSIHSYKLETMQEIQCDINLKKSLSAVTAYQKVRRNIVLEVTVRSD